MDAGETGTEAGETGTEAGRSGWLVATIVDNERMWTMSDCNYGGEAGFVDVDGVVEILEMAAGGAASGPPPDPPTACSVVVGGVDWWLVVGEVGKVESSGDL